MVVEGAAAASTASGRRDGTSLGDGDGTIDEPGHGLFEFVAIVSQRFFELGGSEGRAEDGAEDVKGSHTVGEHCVRVVWLVVGGMGIGRAESLWLVDRRVGIEELAWLTVDGKLLLLLLLVDGRVGPLGIKIGYDGMEGGRSVVGEGVEHGLIIAERVWIVRRVCVVLIGEQRGGDGEV
jgi:hypothetical protein